jgi:hypothetical protein
LTQMALWSLRSAPSQFKLPSKLFFVHMREWIERFQVQISCFLLFSVLLMIWI